MDPCDLAGQGVPTYQSGGGAKSQGGLLFLPLRKHKTLILDVDAGIDVDIGGGARGYPRRARVRRAVAAATRP